MVSLERKIFKIKLFQVNIFYFSLRSAEVKKSFFLAF